MTTLSEAVQAALEDLEGMLADQGKGPVRNGLRMALDTIRSHLLKHYLTVQQPVAAVPGQQVWQDPPAAVVAPSSPGTPAAAPPQPPRAELPVLWKRALERGRQAVLALIEQLQVEGSPEQAEQLATIAAAWQTAGKLKMEPPAPVYDKGAIAHKDDLDDPNVAANGLRTDSPTGT